MNSKRNLFPIRIPAVLTKLWRREDESKNITDALCTVCGCRDSVNGSYDREVTLLSKGAKALYHGES